jgi:hypothetical protein
LFATVATARQEEMVEMEQMAVTANVDQEVTEVSTASLEFVEKEAIVDVTDLEENRARMEKIVSFQGHVANVAMSANVVNVARRESVANQGLFFQ